MKKHITHKQFAEFITEAVDSKTSAYISEHIEQCTLCREKYEKLIVSLSPQFKNKAVLNNKLKHRIMNSYDEIEKLENIKHEKWDFLNLLQPKKIAAAAIALSIIISAFLYNKIFISDSMEKINFTISETKGDVFINENSALLTAAITEGSNIEIKKDSYMELRFENNISIKILGNTLLSINKAGAYTRSKALDLSFTLYRGSLISDINHKNREIKYVYNTPTARIESVGTEFLVQATDEKTILIMRSGSVHIHSTQSKDKITTAGDKKYIVTDLIETQKINDEDIKLYNSYKEIPEKSPMLHDKPILHNKKEEKKSEDLGSEKNNESEASENNSRKNIKDNMKKIKELKKSRRDLRR